jgi:hypothetical protein
MTHKDTHQQFSKFRKEFYQKCFPETWEKEMKEAEERAAKAEERRISPVSAAELTVHDKSLDKTSALTTTASVTTDEERTVPGCFTKLKASLRRISSGGAVSPGL